MYHLFLHGCMALYKLKANKVPIYKGGIKCHVQEKMLMQPLLW